MNYSSFLVLSSGVSAGLGLFGSACMAPWPGLHRAKRGPAWASLSELTRRDANEFLSPRHAPRAFFPLREVTVTCAPLSGPACPRCSAPDSSIRHTLLCVHTSRHSKDAAVDHDLFRCSFRDFKTTRYRKIF